MRTGTELSSAPCGPYYSTRGQLSASALGPFEHGFASTYGRTRFSPNPPGLSNVTGTDPRCELKAQHVGYYQMCAASSSKTA